MRRYKDICIISDLTARTKVGDLIVLKPDHVPSPISEQRAIWLILRSMIPLLLINKNETS